MITSYQQIIDLASGSDRLVKLAIAGKPNSELQSALDKAVAQNMIEPVIFETAEEATKAVSSDQCDMLMKGSVDTKDFMRAVLDKDFGLRTGSLISHTLVVEALNRMIMITDAGICMEPDLRQKAEIIKNAVPIAQKLGIAEPKVAVLAAVEKVNPKMPETVDAKALSEMDFEGCYVQGPLAVDNAISEEAAKTKGITGAVAGKADILVCPSVVAGNMFAKGILYFSDSKFGGIVAGTSKPVIFLSRSDSCETKFNTIALGVVLCFADQK